MSRIRWWVLAGAGLALLVSGQAPAMGLGEFEYRNSCAQCHGNGGKGDGPVSAFLTRSPTDLTTMQKDNGGVFPVSRTYEVIEGTADVRVHGPRDMPLWGSRFRARFDDDEYESFSREDTEDFTQARILALIEYLSTIQVE